MNPYKILDWDSDFFGVPVSQVDLLPQEPGRWPEILNQLKKAGIKLAYWPMTSDNPSFHEFARLHKGKLVDIKTTYATVLDGPQCQPDAKIGIYNKTKADPQLLNLAVQCGKYSRFAVDNGIARKKFEELYQLWIINSANKTMADNILVSQHDKQLAGLVTVYEKSGIGNIGLIGVDESFRGKGIGKALVAGAKHYFYERGIRKLNVVTQGQNLAACRLYESSGFTVLSRYEFYHFWL